MPQVSEPLLPRGTTPVFTLLVAAHNAEATLAATLDSLRVQSFTRWQACVVNDGSIDGTLEVALDYAQLDDRIIVSTQANRGAAAARNAAATRARGPWLLPLDADDVLLPDALSHQAAFIAENPGYDLYSWGIWLEAPDGTRTAWSVSRQHDSVEEFGLEQLIQGNLMTVMTAISEERFRQLGGFRSVHLEDYDLWLRALAAGARHLHNPEMLGVYRLDDRGKNADLCARWRGTAEVLADLAADRSLRARVRRAAAQQARYWRAMDERRQLELSLLDRRYAGARSAYLRARPAYARGLKWLLGLPIMLLSPAVFTGITRPSPARELPSVE